jgi:hypothetical protein
MLKDLAMLAPLDRRDLLRAGAAALGSGLLSPIRTARGEADRSGKPAGRLALGFSLYGMKTLSLDAGLAACAKIGYDAVELAAMPDWPAAPAKLSPDDRRRLRKQLDDLGLALPALMENLDLGADDATDRRQRERL